MVEYLSRGQICQCCGMYPLIDLDAKDCAYCLLVCHHIPHHKHQEIEVVV